MAGAGDVHPPGAGHLDHRVTVSTPLWVSSARPTTSPARHASKREPSTGPRRLEVAPEGASTRSALPAAPPSTWCSTQRSPRESELEPGPGVTRAKPTAPGPGNRTVHVKYQHPWVMTVPLQTRRRGSKQGEH